MARTWTMLGAMAAMACGPPEPATGPADSELDARMLQLAEELAPLVELEALAAERMEIPPHGCEIPRWILPESSFFIHADPEDGTVGVRLSDRERGWHPPTLDPASPHLLYFKMDDEGRYTPVGAGWTYDEAQEGLPDFLGLTEAEREEAWQVSVGGRHALLNAWLWSPQPDHVLGWFGKENLAIDPPGWFVRDSFYHVGSDLRSYYYALLSLEGHSAEVGACITGDDGDVGYPLVHPAYLGQMDPRHPDTLLLDQHNHVLAVQWTWEGEAGPPPAGPFGLPMSGPDSDGNYSFRIWGGARMNPRGLFHPTLPTFSCDEPVVEACKQ